VRSAYFKKILAAGMKEEKKSEIDIVDVRYEVFYEMLQFIYSGHATLNPENVIELWMIADQYRMNNLRQLCENLILHSIDVQNVCSIIGLAYAYGSGALMNHCLDFIAKCFQEIEESEDFLSLPEELQDLIWDRVQPPEQEQDNTMSVSAVLERLKKDIENDIAYDDGQHYWPESDEPNSRSKTYNYTLDELAAITSKKRGEVSEQDEEYEEEYYDEEGYEDYYEENYVEPQSNNDNEATTENSAKGVSAILKEFGLAVQQARNTKKLSRQRLCFTSGIKEAVITNYENGKEAPSKRDLISLQRVLGADFRPYLAALNLDWLCTVPNPKSVTYKPPRRNRRYH